MRMRRNQPMSDPSQAACPSCFYDEVFATAQNLAAGASVTTPVEIEFDRHMCPQFVDVVVMSNANSNINARHVVTDVRIQGCSQLGQDSAAGTASAGIIVPDQLSSSGECCLGTPVCWGGFGKAGLDEDLRFDHTNLDPAAATDTYFLVRGRAMSALPAGWRLGKRCTRAS